MRKPVDPNRPRWPEPLVGGKYVRQLENLIRTLKPDDAHGNRILHCDDVLVCYLLAFFNPTIRSLRTIEDFSQTQQAQRYLSVDRMPRSTVSDFHRVVDPEMLKPIVMVLQEQVRHVKFSRGTCDLPELLGKIVAMDGSFFAVAADVAWAFKKRAGQSGAQTRRNLRLDVHLDVRTWLPEVVSVADGESEAEHALSAIVPGAIHVYDRGIFSFALVAGHEKLGAHFVHRLREAGPRTPRFEAQEERTLSAEDRKAGVLSDRIGHLAGSSHRKAPTQLLREVIIESPSLPEKQIRLLTDLLDIPAHIIGIIYRYRWQVELFFRWLKSCARFRTLMSEERSGIVLQFYAAFIAMLLVHLRTGLRPSKYALNMLSMYVAGTATWEEIQVILARRERERELARARLARKRAEKKI